MDMCIGWVHRMRRVWMWVGVPTSAVHITHTDHFVFSVHTMQYDKG